VSTFTLSRSSAADGGLGLLPFGNRLALRAPGRVADVDPLGSAADASETAAARLPGAGIDEHRGTGAQIEGVGLADAGAEKCLGFDDQTQERCIVQLADAPPWVDPGVEERFGLPDVAGAGECALVHDRIADGQFGAGGLAKAAKCFGGV